MSKPADNRRPIDMLREGAGSFEISTPDDDSKISEMISAGDRLLVVKGKGIYEVKLADQLDPERTNISVPNTIQRVLPYGADNPWVGAVVLTAHHLFLNSCFPKNPDGRKCFDQALKIASNIAGAHLLAEDYLKEEHAIKGTVDTNIRKDRSFILPAIGNTESRCNQFLQRLDHALQELFRIVRMFYPDVNSGGWTALQKKIDDGTSNNDNFSDFLAETVPLLLLIRNARNCVEHPKQDQRLVVSDFSIDSTNTLLPPMIKIIHPKTPQDSLPVSVFFEETLDSIVRIVELLVVFLCARHVRSIGGLPVQIVEFPPEQRRSANERYGYGVFMGGQLVPMS